MTAPSASSAITVRKATVDDAQPILDLVNRLAKDQLMLPRSPASVIEHIRDFAIVESEGQFAGCGALTVIWSDLAEVRSLAVDPDAQERGLGRAVVDHLVAEAHALGIAKLFAFTYVPGFFQKMGFTTVEHASLPHKVFNDCLNCPKFHACDEIAMERVLRDIDDDDPTRGPLSRPLPRLPIPRVR